VKWKRDHNRAGIQHLKGDKWTGPIQSGRWLYHRGIIEPDGDEVDALIVGPKATTSWHEANEKVEVPAAARRNDPRTAGEKEVIHGDPQ